MIGGDDNEGVVEFSDLGEVLESSLDGLVEFHELSEGSGVVERVHLLVDRGSLTGIVLRQRGVTKRKKED